MKVYISVDFEGVAGSTSWNSTNLGDLEHGPLARGNDTGGSRGMQRRPGSRRNGNLY